MITKPQARTFLRQALDRGAEFNAYDLRAYQVTAAYKAADALLAGRHAVLTLPTGTGKTLICGMAAALYLQNRTVGRVLFTAPRRTLLNQLGTRSAWLNPTFPATAVGADPREDDRHVMAKFRHGRVIFGMPEFMGTRLAAGVISEKILSQVSLLIIDEFDHFLTLRYRVADAVVTFHEAIENLLSALPRDCRLLMVSATTPAVAKSPAGLRL
ncbi:DEAD/DEAH box helicase [Asticcacaulis machinosus]|uniref:DEAD/DEAH box helicase n=1 Tax=Asticcacaulis machinosus TaxID=2984211 RepID=A0ABT5HFZ4_9CAUL|nr:DEAD/DEAH box helicase [Asticcacaulis machinosus]MDC7675184.1 DEAD/DEAH box helicase [Asticcacaulis machinosus]